MIQLDLSNDYKNAQLALDNTKGVDFMGVLNDEILVIMEVKNFRGHRIINKAKMRHGEDLLIVEIARKVRDSVAVVVGGSRNSTNQQNLWKKYLAFLENPANKVAIIFWLEEDPPSNRNALKIKHRNRRLNDQFKKRNSWLSTSTKVINSNNNFLEDVLQVSFI